MDDDDPKPRLRKDGKPIKESNVDEHGGYAVGYGRPPAHGQFAKGDGRKRGRRPRGTKNFATDLAEVMAAKVNLREGSKQRRESKQRALLEALAARGTTKSDRAAEYLLNRVEALNAKTERPSLSDRQIIEGWFAQRATEQPGTISDDLDTPIEEESDVGEDGDVADDQ